MSSPRVGSMPDQGEYRVGVGMVTRPVPMPDDVADPAMPKASGRVVLPPPCALVGTPGPGIRLGQPGRPSNPLRSGAHRRYPRRCALVHRRRTACGHVGRAATSVPRGVSVEGVATRAWVHAEVLSPLQQRIWQLATRIPEAGTVALAGSGGLIVRGLVNRISRDVDLFATSADEIDRFLPALEAALQADGLAVERLRIAWGFASLRVSGMGEETGVDIGIQMRLHPPERTPAGPYCPKDDLAAGKVAALCDRAAARDFLDVAALTAHYNFAELCDLAEARYRPVRPSTSPRSSSGLPRHSALRFLHG